MRAREPRSSRGSSSATASASATRSSATGRADGAAPADLVDRPLAASGRRRCRTSPATSGSSPSTGGATAAPIGPTEAAAYDEREFAADALAVLDATGDRARRRSSGSRMGAQLGAAARRRASRARRAARSSSPRACRSRPPTPSATIDFNEDHADPTRAGPSTTGTTGCATTAASSSSSSPDVHRAALDQADRGLHRLGARDDARDADRHEDCKGARRADELRDAVRARALPGARHPRRRRTRSSGGARRRARRGDRRRAGDARGRGARAARRAIRCRSTCCCATSSRRAPPAPRRWPRAIARARSGRCYISSPIGLGHARRDVAIADELRKLHPDLEIDWLAQDPVTRVLAARGERIHPASALPGQRVRATSRASRRARPALLPGLRRMDEILVANFMVFHDLVRRRAATTSGSATRPGRSTTSCTRTPSSSARPTPG